MNRTGRRFGALLGTTAVAAGLLLAPTAALAAPVQMEDAAAACQVESASLSWGMKESFRQYVTGAIAHGSWETYGTAVYVEPELSDTGAVQAGSDLFAWSAGEGSIDPALASGTIAFVGGVHFSGHDGGLELNIAAPGIEFDGADAAYLLLEVSEAPAGVSGTQVRAAKLDLTDRVSASGQALSIAGAPVRLTAEGAAAFNGDSGRGTYVAGQEMDPIFLDATVSGCELGEVVAADIAADEPGEGAGATATPISAETEEPQVPWAPIIIGGVALVVIVVAAGLLFAGRKRPVARTAGAEPDAQGDSPSNP